MKKLFQTVVINENQRGLLFKNGKYTEILMPGKHRFFTGCEVRIAELSQPLCRDLIALYDILRADEEFRKQTTVLTVGDAALALHYVDGRFAGILESGIHVFWTVSHEHTFTIADISSPAVDLTIPRHVLDSIPAAYIRTVQVEEHQKARLYFDKKLVQMLDAGVYYFWRGPIAVDIATIDTRITRMDITGQEILTQDKVAVRVNVTANYRVTDLEKLGSLVDDYRDQLHLCAQLALRDYIGKHKLDEILENKAALSLFILEKLKERAEICFVEIIDADVRDIILPGEIREIMNTVLLAEKRAQANVITRREEVASTRSLLNTAKLMDENRTLYKLKELEYIERIFENVSTVSLNGGGGLISQITGLLGNQPQT